MTKYLIVFLTTIFSILPSETIHVPDEYSTIQSGINASENGDTILVDPGVYQENINFNGRNLVVTSLYQIENDTLMIGSTLIDGQLGGSVVTFESGENDGAVLQGFTVQNGSGNDKDPDGNGSYYTYGGGIYCQNSAPVIKDCIIHNNVGNGGGGGGIFCFDASPVFYNCTITENETDDVGGGLYARDGSSPEFYQCSFSDNVADFGGGCYMKSESTPIMENVYFNGNSATNSGGGIVLKDDANLQANTLFVVDNYAEGLGGGLYVNNANPELSYILIADNFASSGGGAYFRNPSYPSLTNATIVNNTADLYGDGIYMRDDVEVTVLNSILWSNNEAQVYFRSTGNSVALNISYSAIEYGQDGIIDNDNGDLNWGEGNIEDEPLFCNSPGGNYYIRENSPCVDGGENGELIGCFPDGCGPVNIGPVWYVDLNGDDENDGSPESPFATIGRAINTAVDGDTIRLNPGTYTETIDFMDKALVLESRAYETENYSLITETIFTSGPMGGTALSLQGSSNNNATIKGMTFKNGSYTIGGGILLQNCSPTLIDLVVMDNTSEMGGGIYLDQSDAVLQGLTIKGNGANYGGGVYVYEGSPIFENVLFEENIAYWGGGIYFENADPTIDNSVIRNNDAFIEGGGMYQTGGIATIHMTAFENNHGFDYGGAIVGSQATIEIDYVTFSGNVSGAGSVVTLSNSAVDIENSILWGNEGDLFYFPSTAGITAFGISYTNIENGLDGLMENPSIILTLGSGLIDLDPGFCSPENLDYTLNDESPCWTASSIGGFIGSYDGTCTSLYTSFEKIMPCEFFLGQNYPNPFNPKTVIEFGLDKDGDYSLQIFNVKGQWIKTLETGFGLRGVYLTNWDAMDHSGNIVPSGIYLYRLMTEGAAHSGRMFFIK